MLGQRNWQIDIVLSRVCPLRDELQEVFLPSVDQSSVGKSAEEWLGQIESKLRYKR